MDNKIEYHYTPLSIKLTYIPFLILLVMMIGNINDDYYKKISYITFYIWFFSCVICKPHAVVNIFLQKHYGILLILLLYHFSIIALTGGPLQAIKDTGAMIQIYSPIFMYEFYSRFEDEKYNSLLFIIITGIFIFFSVKTLLFLEINPMAARDIISSVIDEVVMIGGGYSLAYGLTIIVPALFYFTIHQIDKDYISNLITKHKIANKVYRLILLFIIILFSAVIVKSMYVISFFLLIFGFILTIVFVLFNKFKKKHAFLIIISIVLFFLVTKGLFVDSVLNYVSTVESFPVLMSRVIDVINIFQNMSFTASDDLVVRSDLYMDSLSLFFDNFIFGIGYKYSLDFVLMHAAGLGTHSEWFDTLAKYGVFGLFMIWFLISARKIYFEKKGFKIAFLLFIILGFVNPVNLFTIYFATFYYVPKIPKMIS
jgi:hypothetical protein